MATINDTELRDLVKKNVLVSGGSIASLYLGEPVNDFDIYIQDRGVLMQLVKYYVKDTLEILDGHDKESLIDQYSEGFSRAEFMKKPGHRASSLRTLKDEQIKLYVEHGGGKNMEIPEEDKNAKKYLVSYFSPNAISLTDQVQIVIRFWGTPEEIHKSFDFIHATNYWTDARGVVINLQAVESLLTKQLKYQGSYYPLTSIIRTKKFIKRGWNINAGEMLKMMFQLSLLDLTNFDVLEEQSIGVDVAYFEALINALRGKQESDPYFVLTFEYFNVLIDKIFNNHQEEK